MGGALRHQAVTTATTTSKPVPSEVRSILGARSSSNLAGLVGMIEILYDWYGRVEVQCGWYGLLWFAASWWWRAHVFWFNFGDGFFAKLCSSTLVRGTFEADQLLLGSTFVRELQLLVVGLKDLLM